MPPNESPHWTQIHGHADQQTMVRRAIARRRFSHTQLFAGPAGVGKRLFARLLAQCLFCERVADELLDACGVCAACQQVAANTHPDLLLIDKPDGKSELPIELFTGPPERRGKAGLCYELSLRPMAGGRKIAIIDCVELLNDASANALLKTLEEPPSHALLILVTSAAETLLPTIRSRCQTLRFAPLPPNTVAELLLRQGLTEDSAQAAAVAELSDGSLDNARQLLDPALRSVREQLYAGLSAEPLNSVQLAGVVRAAVEQAGGETAAQRLQAAWIMRFALEFYRQVLRQLGGVPRHPVEPEVERAARNLSQTVPEPVETAGELLDRCQQALRELEGMAAIPLLIDAWFDDLARRSRSPASRSPTPAPAPAPARRSPPSSAHGTA